MSQLLMNKAFFGKNNCLKVMLNSSKECYFHFGVLINEKWQWKKIKMQDTELGSIMMVLDNQKSACSFYHKYNAEATQIWVNRSNQNFFIKANKQSKQLTDGEQVVLRVLLEKIIWVMNT